MTSSLPEVHQYASLDQLVLNTGTLYLVFGFGTGDTFNAMVHLCKAPPQCDYELIIKRPQLNLVLFLLGLFDHVPRQVHAVDYWKHDFSAQLLTRFPTIPFVRGVEPHSTRSGFIDFWQNPGNYNKIIPLNDDDIARIAAYFRAVPPQRQLPEGSVVLFPTAGANFSDYVPAWASIVDTLKRRGLTNVYVNQSGVADYGDESIAGAEPISMPHDELIRSFHTGRRLAIIAVRSGVLDILRFCGQRALVLYQPEPSGIFETCRFGLLRHNLDMIEAICLNVSTEHQHRVIEYYVENFIASPLER